MKNELKHNREREGVREKWNKNREINRNNIS